MKKRLRWRNGFSTDGRWLIRRDAMREANVWVAEYDLIDRKNGRCRVFDTPGAARAEAQRISDSESSKEYPSPAPRSSRGPTSDPRRGL